MHPRVVERATSARLPHDSASASVISWRSNASTFARSPVVDELDPIAHDPLNRAALSSFGYALLPTVPGVVVSHLFVFSRPTPRRAETGSTAATCAKLGRCGLASHPCSPASPPSGSAAEALVDLEGPTSRLEHDHEPRPRSRRALGADRAAVALDDVLHDGQA
jgi:hypothetical protein